MSSAGVIYPQGIWYPTVQLRWWFASPNAKPVLQQRWVSLSGDQHDWRDIDVVEAE